MKKFILVLLFFTTVNVFTQEQVVNFESIENQFCTSQEAEIFKHIVLNLMAQDEVTQAEKKFTQAEELLATAEQDLTQTQVSLEESQTAYQTCLDQQSQTK